MSKFYNAFGPYIRKKFGDNIYKVNIDAGFTCPNRDGTVAYGGCIYCNNDSFRPSSCSPSLSIEDQVSNGIAYLSKRYGARRFIAYFQPYTNTYASVEELARIYSRAMKRPEVIGIAIGTRPDAIDNEKLTLLEALAKDYFVLIEYGIQSLYEKSLEFINRGHGYDCFAEAVKMTGGRGIYTGAHIIAGFPTETREEMLSMAEDISSLSIDFLKIHQLQVVRDTRLARIYGESPFFVFNYREYLDFLVEFIERLSPDIVLQRLFATAPDDILIAPKWFKSRQEITRDIDRSFQDRGAMQGRLFGSFAGV